MSEQNHLNRSLEQADGTAAAEVGVLLRLVVGQCPVSKDNEARLPAVKKVRPLVENALQFGRVKSIFSVVVIVTEGDNARVFSHGRWSDAIIAFCVEQWFAKVFAIEEKLISSERILFQNAMLCFGHETKTVDPQKNISAANQKRVKSERCETDYLFEFVGGKILIKFPQWCNVWGFDWGVHEKCEKWKSIYILHMWALLQAINLFIPEYCYE